MSKFTINKIEQINLEVFGGCNLACPMCPQGIKDGREKEFKKSLNEDLFKKIIDEAIPLGLKYVNLSGSGEPLMNKKFSQYCSYLKEKGIISMINTNGKLLTLEKFEELCEAGLSIIKISCMGWDRESYAKFMSYDNYDNMRETLKKCIELLKRKKYDTFLQTHHLIQDYEKKDYQLEMYKKNWIDYLNIPSEVWMAHNWSGGYVEENAQRSKTFKTRNRRSCGRPLANVIEIRAGGLGKSRGAVVPCPNVLGHDSLAVMGTVENNKLIDVVNNKTFQALRKKHIDGDFDTIDFCKDCDHLIDVPESLVWTNIKGREYGGSRVSFIDFVNSIENYK